MSSISNDQNSGRDTDNLKNKCSVCNKELPEEDAFNICEQCRAECIHIAKILSYLKTTTIEDLMTEKKETPPPKKVEKINCYKSEKPQSKEYIPPTPKSEYLSSQEQAGKAYVGTTVLGSDDKFFTSTNDIERMKAGMVLPKAWLYRCKTKEKVLITKQFLKIGKKQNEVDYCIKGNNAVSRYHAQIIYKDNKFFLIDNNSTNGTYLNGRALKPFDEVLLKNDEHITFVDEEFIFTIERGNQA